MNTDKNFKFAVIGGDDRQYYMARRFRIKGYKCSLWGCGKTSGNSDGPMSCITPDEAIAGSDAVVLPLPLSRDGEYLNSRDSLGGLGGEIRLSDVFAMIPSGIPALCGGVNQFSRSLAGEHGVTLYDYYDNEGVMIKNAWLTAEGAIEVLIREIPVSIRDSSFAVFGFGRVGSAVAAAIKALGGHVYVFARSSKDLACASISGCTPVLLKKRYSGNTVFDAVINTVPYMIFDNEMLSSLKINGVMIDLASCDTYDKYAVKKLGIKAIKALSIPGKTSPATAADILCDSVLDVLYRENYIR